MRKLIASLAALIAHTSVQPAFADGPLPASLRSAGVTQEQWDALQAEVRRTAARANVSERALAAVAERLGVVLAEGGRQVAVSDILNQLQTLATRIAELEARLTILARDEDPAIAALIAQSQDAIAAGDLDAADAALAAARLARAERNVLRRAQLEAGQLEEAEIVAAQAEVALLRIDYITAATLFAEAAGLAPEGARERWSYTLEQAIALAAHADEFFNEESGVRAIATFGDALALAPRERSPAEWAATHLELGEAEETLGRDDAAAAAWRAALEVFTREAYPDIWAVTQYKLAGVVTDPHEAVALYREVLAASPREADANEWAAAQYGLGETLLQLGAAGDSAAMAEGMRLLREIAEAFPDDSVWSVGVQIAIANAVSDFEFDPANEAGIIAMARAQMIGLDKERQPGSWVSAQMFLAIVLASSRDEATIREGEGAFREVLETIGPEHGATWVGAQRGLGTVLARLGNARDTDDDFANLYAALAAYETAKQVASRAEHPGAWAEIEVDRAHVLALLGAGRNREMLREARRALERALVELSPRDNPELWREAEMMIGSISIEMGDFTEAQAAYERVLARLDPAQHPEHLSDWARSREGIGDALLARGEYGDDEPLRAALVSYQAALDVQPRARAPDEWLDLMQKRALALSMIGRRGDLDALREAIATRREVLQVVARDSAPGNWADLQLQLAADLRAMVRLGRREHLPAALEAAREALSVFELSGQNFDANSTRRLIAELEAL